MRPIKTASRGRGTVRNPPNRFEPLRVELDPPLGPDADLLARLARHGAARVLVSLATLDPTLHRAMEPRTSRPILLRLPHALKELFESWLDEHFPERKREGMERPRDMRRGRSNDPRFGSRMQGEGPFAEQIQPLHGILARRLGLDGELPTLSIASFLRPCGPQLEPFQDAVDAEH